MRVLGAVFDGKAIDWALRAVAGREWTNAREIQRYLDEHMPGLSDYYRRRDHQLQAAARAVVSAGIRAGALEPRGMTDAPGWPARRVRSYKVKK